MIVVNEEALQSFARLPVPEANKTQKFQPAAKVADSRYIACLVESNECELMHAIAMQSERR